MKPSTLCLSLVGVLMLSACGSAAKDASKHIADNLIPPYNNKPTGWKTVKLEKSVPNPDNYLEISGDSAVKGGTYKTGNSLDISKLKQDKLSSIGFTSGIIKDGQKTKLEEGELQIYKQAHSVVIGKYIKQTFDNNHHEKAYSLTVNEIQGENTPLTALPKEGTFNYTGTAFDGTTSNGKLSYNIDFSKKEGSGNISGISGGDLILNSAKIKDTTSAISGLVTGSNKGNYDLSIFGKNAEEIAGKVHLENNKEIGFAGKK